VELNDAPTGVGHLLGARVYDQNGKKLGRVHELRGHREDDGTVVIDELLLGRRALFRRLRGPGPDAGGVPVEAVIESGPERIVLRR
jgi:sporulation protein YlmC with PRC-barrel domain